MRGVVEGRIREGRSVRVSLRRGNLLGKSPSCRWLREKVFLKVKGRSPFAKSGEGKPAEKEGFPWREGIAAEEESPRAADEAAGAGLS